MPCSVALKIVTYELKLLDKTRGTQKAEERPVMATGETGRETSLGKNRWVQGETSPGTQREGKKQMKSAGLAGRGYQGP